MTTSSIIRRRLAPALAGVAATVLVAAGPGLASPKSTGTKQQTQPVIYLQVKLETVYISG